MTDPLTETVSRDDITPELLRELLTCDPETGKLTWNERARRHFTMNCAHALWNVKYAGKSALCFTNKKGYDEGSVFSFKFQAHRVVWAVHYGAWPIHGIDHINGIKNDNRIANLRDVDQQANVRNSAMQANNRSGHRGVNFIANRWRANIGVRGRTISLGGFLLKEEAIAARKAAEKQFGFHPNHGRLAASPLAGKEG